MLNTPYDYPEYAVDEPFEFYEDEDYDSVQWSDADDYYVFQPDVGIIVGLIAAFLFIFLVARSGPTTTWAKDSAPQSNSASAVAAQNPPTISFDPREFAAPYADYVLTQGPHGQSYGHLAIDLAAGKGAPVLSPINGTVTEKYTDQYGNPTLIIENAVYRIILLHGIYSAGVGDVVEVGDEVGVESNLGYTTNMRGERCAGRTDYCGYHTHLNVYDKEKGVNVNPLDLLGP